MSNRVISIESKFYDVLAMLFPEYSYGLDSPKNAIIFRDIKSIQERSYLDYRYIDCVFVSSVIFDEVWDQERISKECVAFAKLRYNSRKTKFLIDLETPKESLMEFLFGSDEVPEHQIIFDSVGSSSFLPRFLSACHEQPYQQLRKAVITFLHKSGVSEDIYFLRKRTLFNKLKTYKYFLLYKDTIKESSSLKFAYKLSKIFSLTS